MKKWLGFLLIIMVTGLLQATVLNVFGVFRVKPDILFVLALFACVVFRPKQAILLAGCAGLMKDIFGIGQIGYSILFFSSCSFAIIKISRNIAIENEFIYTAFVFVFTILNNLAIKIAMLLAGNNIPLGQFIKVLSLESVYNSIVAFFIFLLGRKYFDAGI